MNYVIDTDILIYYFKEKSKRCKKIFKNQRRKYILDNCKLL